MLFSVYSCQSQCCRGLFFCGFFSACIRKSRQVLAMLFQSKLNLTPRRFFTLLQSHLLPQDSRGNLCSLTRYTPVATNVPQSLKVTVSKNKLLFPPTSTSYSLLLQVCPSFSHPDPTQIQSIVKVTASKSKSPSFSLSLVQKFIYYLYSYNKFSGLSASNLISFQ